MSAPSQTESGASPAGSATPRGLGRFLPILSWLPRYDRSWFRHDLIAAVAVAALVVPKSLGYAGIAGVPIQNGLYAAAAGSLIYAVFGTSRQISTGPSSAFAALAASALLATGAGGGDHAIEIVTATTLVPGGLFLAALEGVGSELPPQQSAVPGDDA